MGSLEQSAAIFTLVGVAQGVIYPVGAIIIATSTAPSERGKANGIYMLFSNINMAVSPVLMGFVAEYWGFRSSSRFSP